MSYNPIRSIQAVDYNGNYIGTAVYNIPCPSEYLYKLVDVSAPSAGRIESGKTNKMRKGQAVRIDLSWKYPTIANCSLIMQTFNPQYLEIDYLDALEGNYKKEVFYVGDRSAPLWNSKKGVWESVGFGIIQQDITAVSGD